MQTYPRGQIGLMLLIIMAVVVALVLSLASRSLSDTVLSRQDVESNGAFQSAESGVEAALNQIRQNPAPTTIPISMGIFQGNSKVSLTPNYALYVREGETAQLSTVGVTGNLTIYWTKKTDAAENLTCVSEGSGKAPAAMGIAMYQPAGNTVSYKFYNPAGCTLPGNGFAAGTAGVGDYLSSASVALTAGTTYVRIMPLYDGATVAAAGNGLSAQLYLIQSTTSGGDAQSDIQVQRSIEAPGSVFDYALFSGSTIVK